MSLPSHPLLHSRGLPLVALAVVVVCLGMVALIDPAAAQGAADPFAMVTQKGTETISKSMPLARLIAIGALLCAFILGIVMRGKFPFGWLFAIVGGLIGIAVAAGFVDFFMTMS